MSATFQSVIAKDGNWTEKCVGIHQLQSVFLKITEPLYT